MKQYFKRFVAVALCIAVCFSFFVVPSYATVSDAYTYVVKTFPSFLRQYLSSPINTSLPSYLTGIADALMNGTATDEEIQNAYDNYVNNIQNTVGTVSITNDGIRLYMIPDGTFASASGVFSSYSVPFTIGTYSISTFTYTPITSIIGYCSPLGGQVQVGYQAINIPFQASYTYHLVTNTDKCVYAPTTSIATTFNAPAGTTIDYIGKITASSAGAFSANVAVYFDIVPYTGVVNDYYSDIDISIDGRMTTIIPKIYNYNTTNTEYQYHIGTVENNAVTNVYDTNIFNETTNVFTLPGDTPTTYNITDWTYDYSTRTYVCVDSDSNVYIVQYGDDAVHVTVPDGSGGTTSYTYYYIYQEPVPSPGNTDDTTTFPGTSSDNYDDDPNTTGGFWSTIWKAFKDGLADLIAGIVKDLFKGLKAIITGILNVFSGLVTGFFDSVNSFFNSFSETGVFQFWNGMVTDLS